MVKYPGLLITTCSNSKQRDGEIRGYDKTSSICMSLSQEYRDGLYNKRSYAFNKIHSPLVKRDGKVIENFPLNSDLILSPDITTYAEGDALYLPAIVRYSGRFYRELGSPEVRYALFENAKIHILIISGLYGALLPFEQIQSYGFNIKDSNEVKLSWIELNFLTTVIIEYIRKNQITKVIEAMGDESYKNLINWTDIRFSVNKNLLHTYSKQYSSADLLVPLGNLTKIMLKEFSEGDYSKIGAGSFLSTAYENIYFEQYRKPDLSSDYAFNESEAVIQLTYSDRIGRMRRNIHKYLDCMTKENRLIEYKDGLGSMLNELNSHRIISKE